jgi:hypothetical protein
VENGKQAQNSTQKDNEIQQDEIQKPTYHNRVNNKTNYENNQRTKFKIQTSN